MHVDVAGDAPPVLLFLHAEYGPEPESEFAVALSPAGTVGSVHLPGFGASGPMEEGDGVLDAAYACMDYVDQLPDGHAVSLVGASLGAWVALQFATLYPHRVRRLALIAPLGLKLSAVDEPDFVDLFAHSSSTLAEALFADPAADPWGDGDPDDDAILRRANYRESLVRYGWSPYLHDPRLPRRLARVTMPTLLVEGSDDGFVRPHYYDDFAKRLPNATLVELDRAGHFPTIERPQATAEAVLRFLA